MLTVLQLSAATVISQNPDGEIRRTLISDADQGIFYVAMYQRVRENIFTLSLRGAPKARRSNLFRLK